MHYQKSKFLSETTKLDSILERKILIKLHLLYFINNFFNKRLKDFIKHLLRVKYIIYIFNGKGKLPGDIILVGCIWRDMTGKNIFSPVSDSCNVFIIKVLFSAGFLKGKYISELLKRAQRVVDESTVGFQVRLELCGFESALLRTRGPRSSCTAVKMYALRV